MPNPQNEPNRSRPCWPIRRRRIPKSICHVDPSTPATNPIYASTWTCSLSEVFLADWAARTVCNKRTVLMVAPPFYDFVHAIFWRGLECPIAGNRTYYPADNGIVRWNCAPNRSFCLASMLRPTASRPFRLEETNSIAIAVAILHDPPNAPVRTPIDELCPTAKWNQMDTWINALSPAGPGQSGRCVSNTEWPGQWIKSNVVRENQICFRLNGTANVDE